MGLQRPTAGPALAYPPRMVAIASGARMWGSCESRALSSDADRSTTRTAIEVGVEESAGRPALPPPPHRLTAPLQRRDPDRYELLGEHGRGGLGTVTRAHDKELGRNVAIKELIKRGDAGEVRFLREAMITARLEHPGIVPVHEAGQWPDGTPFYVMKLVAGRSLKEMIAKCSTVACRIGLLHHVVAVADAVAYAHKRKIIHRDLKPGNVIVGDFGETVVIDWGLAKDLSELEDSDVPDERSPYRAPVLDDLTQAGDVLGTPMYMAPEQWRGERVDQRADVFAIGAMLWELCSKHRVPPAEPRVRDKLLRRANIDADLIAIIGKALSQSPAARYQNAGELASDLRAFTSGARIASRRYSLADVAVHWIRHHRAIAAIAAAALVLGVIGATVYIRNIGVERDRAESFGHESARANDELVLQNAELLMPRDPSAVIDALASYRGKDKVRADLLRAEARGRGVAEARFNAHSHNVHFVHRASDGSIYTLGEDRRVVVTKNGVSTTLATDVGPTAVFAHKTGVPVLAYVAAPTGIVVLDLVTRATKRLDTEPPTNLAISSDGALLAALHLGGKLLVWNLASSELVHEANLGQAFVIEFSGKTLIAQSATELMTMDLAVTAPAMTKRPLKLVSFHGEGEILATGDDKGTITLHDRSLAPIVATNVCHSTVVSVRLVVRQDLVVFACRERIAGVARYDAQRKTLTVDHTTELDGAPMYADSDPDGKRMFVLVHPSSVLVLDLESHITRTLRGHSARFTTIPFDDAERIVTGDADGNVRVWSWGATAARRLVQASRTVYGAASAPDGRVVVTDGLDGIVRRIDLETGSVLELKGQTPDGVIRTRFAADGRSFFGLGLDSTVRVWDARTNETVRVFAEHRGMVSDAAYVGSDRIVSAGADGRLLAWSSRGTDTSVLLARPHALTMLEVLRSNNRVVVCDGTNAVVEVSLDGTSRQIVPPSSDTITLLRTSPDGTLIAIGRASGAVTVYATATYRTVYAGSITGAVHQIQFDPKNRDFAIQSDGGFVRVVALGGRVLPWRELALEGCDVAYSPDGDTLGIIDAAGATWFYEIRADRWRFSPDLGAAPKSGRFTADGTRFVSTDVSGTVVAHDLRIF
ncbi:MAG TPA: WD40 repeat domain-containing serine/threonine-protein kinase [Kofleriaceae bacterium]